MQCDLSFGGSTSKGKGIRPSSGYAYTYEGADWKGSSDEEWDTGIVADSDIPKAHHVGERMIDGSRMIVFRLVKGDYIAQLPQNVTGSPAPPKRGRRTTDKAVIKAFTEKRSAESKKLTSDGQRLDGNWMGGRGIAEWRSGKIHFQYLGSKAAQKYQRAIRRVTPANWIADNPGHSPTRLRNEHRKVLDQLKKGPKTEKIDDVIVEYGTSKPKDIKGEEHWMTRGWIASMGYDNPEGYRAGMTRAEVKRKLRALLKKLKSRYEREARAERKAILARAKKTETALKRATVKLLKAQEKVTSLETRTYRAGDARRKVLVPKLKSAIGELGAREKEIRTAREEFREAAETHYQRERKTFGDFLRGLK